MGLHSINPEFSFPTHLTAVHLLGVAKFLKEYDGKYPVIISRVPDLSEISVWYIESEYSPDQLQQFSNYALVSWANDEYYSSIATFRWEDVLIVNNINEIRFPLKTKRYIRHD